MNEISKPNIIVIMADDLGHGDIGFYGNTDVVTPNIDAMAREGISLKQHYSASPMCAPARAAFLTGKYPHRVGCVDVSTSRGLDRIAEDQILISERFKSLGYTTGMVGKWHNGRDEDKYHPLNRGFDEFTGFCMGASDYWDWKIEKNNDHIPSDGRYLTDVFTDEAIDFIKRHREKPFFLMITYNAPHTPLQAYKEDISLFMNKGKFNKAVSTIYAMVKRMDEGIGLLRNTLEKENIKDNTVILFTSDNGPCFRGEGEECRKRFNIGLNGMKGFSLEGGIRVPGILTVPWIQAGVEIDPVIHFTDWYKTLLSLAGADSDEINGIDGEDMSEVLKNMTKPEKRMVFWQWNRISPVRKCNAAAREGRYKLYYEPIPEAVEYMQSETKPFLDRLEHPWDRHPLNTLDYSRTLSKPSRPMLFDIDADPGEECDVSGHNPELYKKLIDRTEEWFEDMILQWHDSIKLTLKDAASIYKPDK
ncbi:MAG: sulfatase-like hydrolase/transferase [Clostridia bacterium]|nr:sulfatase-like hydrolase/transferase [Clostridia bacterium]